MKITPLRLTALLLLLLLITLSIVIIDLGTSSTNKPAKHPQLTNGLSPEEDKLLNYKQPILDTKPSIINLLTRSVEKAQKNIDLVSIRKIMILVYRYRILKRSY